MALQTLVHETRYASSLDAIGQGISRALVGHIRFDRFNIGVIDQQKNLFHDSFVLGQNVPGREQNHRRTLSGTVVSAAIQAGDGFYFGDNILQQWLQRFPNFTPVFESGIRSMMAIPLRDNDRVRASLVFASTEADAYSQNDMELAVAVGKTLREKIIAFAEV